jgi:hypothetical protein
MTRLLLQPATFETNPSSDGLTQKQHMIATRLSVVQQQYTCMACSNHLTSAQTKGGWNSEDCYVCHGGLHEPSCILVWKSQSLTPFSAMFMATRVLMITLPVLEVGKR